MYICLWLNVYMYYVKCWLFINWLNNLLNWQIKLPTKNQPNWWRTCASMNARRKNCIHTTDTWTNGWIRLKSELNERGNDRREDRQLDVCVCVSEWTKQTNTDVALLAYFYFIYFWLGAGQVEGSGNDNDGDGAAAEVARANC